MGIGTAVLLRKVLFQKYNVKKKKKKKEREKKNKETKLTKNIHMKLRFKKIGSFFFAM